MTLSHQTSILLPPALYGRSLTLSLRAGRDARRAITRLAAGYDSEWGAIGIGRGLVDAIGANVPGLRAFPSLAAAVTVPATQGDLWVSLRGGDRSEVFDRGEAFAALVGDDFAITDSMETFLYAGGRDLTGYEDGTANPPAEEAPDVALCAEGTPLARSSFVAVQRWVHDLARFRAHSSDERDAIIGRRIADNEEIEDAPESAHVKRTAQELYDPEAFMVRRSLPFASGGECGLEFVSYCRTLDAFERMMRHMAGLDDGIVDALFDFSCPVTGGYYWCPPLRGGRLDLAVIGIG